MTAARRLAAIMAIDFVGYSRLMGEDERTSQAVAIATSTASMTGLCVATGRRLCAESARSRRYGQDAPSDGQPDIPVRRCRQPAFEPTHDARVVAGIEDPNLARGWLSPCGMGVSR